MKKNFKLILFLIVYILFIIISYFFDIKEGQQTIANLYDFAKEMILLLPFAFIIIGLFEVWIKKETVEKYLGMKAGFSAYLLAIALAGTTIGGLYVAFPFAYSLYKKGARLGIIFTYVSCAGICRIPMTIFEASFIGTQFTIVRFAVSLPLVVLSSWLMGEYLQNRNYKLKEPLMKKA